MANEEDGTCNRTRTIVIRNVCSLPDGHAGEHSEESWTAPSDPMDDGRRWTSWSDENDEA
jgi:hypothetical protein